MAQYGKPEYWEDRYQKWVYWPRHSFSELTIDVYIEIRSLLTGTRDTQALRMSSLSTCSQVPRFLTSDAETQVRHIICDLLWFSNGSLSSTFLILFVFTYNRIEWGNVRGWLPTHHQYWHLIHRYQADDGALQGEAEQFEIHSDGCAQFAVWRWCFWRCHR